MNQRFIILKMQDIECLVPKNPIFEVEDIAYTDDEGCLIIFNSLDDAKKIQEENGILGTIVELPLYYV